MAELDDETLVIEPKHNNKKTVTTKMEALKCTASRNEKNCKLKIYCVKVRNMRAFKSQSNENN